MTTSPDRATSPANSPVLSSDGQLTLAWRQYLAMLGTKAPRVGDYLQTARSDLGNGWLLCDGSYFDSTQYPKLQAVLAGLTSKGAADGTWQLPNITAVYDASHPEPGGPPVLVTYIRAA